MITSLTSELTIAPKATPMMIPIAKSRTFPRKMNSLNSANIFFINNLLLKLYLAVNHQTRVRKHARLE